MGISPQDIDPTAAGTAAGLGLLGRLLLMAQADKRRWGWSLAWELPTAIALGFIGMGIADYLELKGFTSYAVTIATSYVGPRVIDSVIEIFLASAKKRAGGDGA